MRLGMVPLHFARQVKHRGFVAGKWIRAAGANARFGSYSLIGPAYSKRVPYKFDPARYRRSFLVRDIQPDPVRGSEFPRRVFVLWTGTNPLTPARARSLKTLEATLGLPVVLITPETVDDWVVDGHPLHPGYEHLSLVHRSDYLRAYLLHHHGGGYADLKRPHSSWEAAYDRMVAMPSVWLTGYPELNAQAPARFTRQLGHDIALRHSDLVGLGALLVRSYTPLTAQWLTEVERRMDYYLPQLREFPGAVRGEVVGYPVSWTRLLGGVLHPLMLKHLAHIRQEKDLLMDFTDYQ